MDFFENLVVVLDGLLNILLAGSESSATNDFSIAKGILLKSIS